MEKIPNNLKENSDQPKHNRLAFIVAKAGRRRDSLRAMLEAVPHQLEIIGQADDGSAALKMIADHHPALVLLDSNLPDDKVWTVLQQIKTEWSQIRCLVLVDNIQQEQAALVAHADRVLVNGFSLAKFLSTMEELLSG